MLYFIKKIAYREGGFIILEEEGSINQQTRLTNGRLALLRLIRRMYGAKSSGFGTDLNLPLVNLLLRCYRQAPQYS